MNSPTNTNNKRPTSSSSQLVISPKDLIALELPIWTTPHPSPSSLEQYSTNNNNNKRLSLSSNRRSWNPTPPPPTSLTPLEIKGIEELGVKFIDPPIITPHQNTLSSSSLNRSNSHNPTIHRVSSTRRNSTTTTKRRKSLKLNLPSTTTTTTENNSTLQPVGISSDQLLKLISNPKEQPILVIDLRSLNTYLGPNGRLKGSINVNFPSLLIKRFRKGTPSHFQLNPFITTEAGKRYYSKLEKSYQQSINDASGSSSVLSQLDICVIDDQLVDELLDQPSTSSHLPKTTNSFGRIFLDVLANLFSQRQRTSGLFFLTERFESLSQRPDAHHSLLFGEPHRPERSSQEGTCPLLDRSHLSDLSHHSTHQPSLTSTLTTTTTTTITTTTTTTTTTTLSSGPQGLLRLRPSAPVRSLPSIDQANLTCEQTQQPGSAACSPGLSTSLVVSEPVSSKTKPPKLRRIDTSESFLSAPRSTASLALSAKTSLAQLKIDHLSITCSSTSSASHPSTSHELKLSSSPHDHPPTPSTHSTRPHVKFSDQVLSTTQQGTSRLTSSAERSYDRSPCSPNTDPEINFKVSTIIPSFLYLGPEPSKETDFAELKRLGIQRILNTALECVDEEELVRDRYPFVRKYFLIPLRDFVEETGVQKGIEQANRILNDAFLHSAPTYVHCKAGKSRSVTIVLAYLIHRYRWSLKKSYAHVSERRQGICPNIGFLAELMNFEQRELGSKSHSILGPNRASRAGEGPLLSHKKSARSVSHHYPSSSSSTGFCMSTAMSTTRSHVASPGQIDKGSVTDDHHHGPSGSFATYSLAGKGPPPSSALHHPHQHQHHHPHPSKAFSVDLDHSPHRFRVRSLALASKNEFFFNSSESVPLDSLDPSSVSVPVPLPPSSSDHKLTDLAATASAAITTSLSSDHIRNLHSLSP